MLVGMDFGTTNSGMAWFDGEKVNLLPLDPANNNPTIARTALYINNNQTVAIGRDALESYFEQNVGRPTKMKKVWVGEVEVYGADMYYVTDVYAWTDILSPGRLFLSIKSGLRDPDYKGTMVGRFYYSLETLIAAYLSLTKIRAERILGREITGVVLGRPVHFSLDPKDDALAESRLLEAALNAGYREVYFQYEPVAAAYHYAAAISEQQNVLVFDFGGGTLDITIMHLGSNDHRVLATSGIPVAGDIFDQKLVRAKLPRHFGEKSRYGSPDRRLPLPAWIFDLFSNWQTIIELQTTENRRILSEIVQTADDREGLEGLISLVTNNYGLKMFDIVENAKVRLSSDMASMIRFKGPGFHVTDTVSRSEFEQLIAAEIQAIGKHVDETVREAGLKVDEIDTVIRTGGSAEIPAFKRLLASRFGFDKIRAIDTFSSVASGLGLLARSIRRGEIEAVRHELSSLKRQVRSQSMVDITPVNLRLLQRRMVVQEEQSAGRADEQDEGLVLLTAGAKIILVPKGVEHLPETGSADLPIGRSSADVYRSALVASSLSPLLMATSHYRFFLSSMALLADLQELGIESEYFYHLREDEYFTAIAPWFEIRHCPKMLVLTSQGYVRAYPVEKIAETIDGYATLEFDQPLPGTPVSILGSEEEDLALVITDSGRAIYFNAAQLPQAGKAILKVQKAERIIFGAMMDSSEELMLITADGYGKRLPTEWIPLADNGASRGRKVIARSDLRGAAPADSQTWVLTAEEIIRVDSLTIPKDPTRTTRAHPIRSLRGKKAILGIATRQQSKG